MHNTVLVESVQVSTNLLQYSNSKYRPRTFAPGTRLNLDAVPVRPDHFSSQTRTPLKDPNWDEKLEMPKMPSCKLPDSGLLNSEQLPLGTTNTPNHDFDEPPPAYAALSPSSSQPASTSSSPQQPTGTSSPPSQSEGYRPNPPMPSCTSLKPWEIHPLTREQLEKAPGCFCSKSGGCFCSDMGGCCFSSNVGCLFSDNKGCCFSDHAGCCFGDYGGCCCSSGPLK
ncbi:hypothetical protein QBC37DRAFT_371311 [Rhypophila decipiens]|uniref:Uncharacterized protein n=1 Tax=Rhypophila decipiens TaxID=261697 RepID=A0AAN6YDU2_9PEZI|nr:hypothetical protein QBC37DRAFT_371311 [Rhypophila decipiens]